MSADSDDQPKLKCRYKLDAMPKSTWHYGWTMDGIRVPLNRKGRLAFTCHNSLCESDLYKEAVGKFNDFVAGLIHSFSGIGNPVWWYRGQALHHKRFINIARYGYGVPGRHQPGAQKQQASYLQPFP